MDYSVFDDRTLYFEMLVRPHGAPNDLHEVRGFATMRASKTTVSIAWSDYPGAGSGKSVTFDQKTPSEFRPNDGQQAFRIGEKQIVPDFLYFDRNMASNGGH